MLTPESNKEENINTTQEGEIIPENDPILEIDGAFSVKLGPFETVSIRKMCGLDEANGNLDEADGNIVEIENKQYRIHLRQTHAAFEPV